MTDQKNDVEKPPQCIEDLFQTVEENDIEKAKTLLFQCTLGGFKDWAYLILLSAIKDGKIEIVKLFLNLNYNVNTVIKDGITLLMYAVLNRQKNIIELLLNSGANINARDNSGGEEGSGRTVFRIAAHSDAQINDGEKLLDFLLKYNQESRISKDDLNNKEILKNKLARKIISCGEEDFDGEQDIARSLLDDLIESDGSYILAPVQIYAIAVKKYLEKGCYEQALKWLDYALIFKNEFYQVYYRKGEIFRLKYEYDTAIKYYTDGINEYRKNKDPQKDIYGLAWGYIERALCYIKLKKYDEAHKDLIYGKNEMKKTESPYSAGFSNVEVDKLVELSLLAQYNNDAADKLLKMISHC